jgi:hypothetical protein
MNILIEKNIMIPMRDGVPPLPSCKASGSTWNIRRR